MKISPDSLLMLVVMAIIALGFSFPYLKEQYTDYKLSQYQDVLRLTPENISKSEIDFNTLSQVRLTLHLNGSATEDLHNILALAHHETVAIVFQDDQIGELTQKSVLTDNAIVLTLPPSRAGQIHYAIGH